MSLAQVLLNKQQQDLAGYSQLQNSILGLDKLIQAERIKKLGIEFMQKGDFTPEGLKKFAVEHNLSLPEMANLVTMVKAVNSLQPKPPKLVKVRRVDKNGNVHETYVPERPGLDTVVEKAPPPKTNTYYFGNIPINLTDEEAASLQREAALNAAQGVNPAVPGFGAGMINMSGYPIPSSEYNKMQLRKIEETKIGQQNKALKVREKQVNIAALNASINARKFVNYVKSQKFNEAQKVFKNQIQLYNTLISSLNKKQTSGTNLSDLGLSTTGEATKDDLNVTLDSVNSVAPTKIKQLEDIINSDKTTEAEKKVAMKAMNILGNIVDMGNQLKNSVFGNQAFINKSYMKKKSPPKNYAGVAIQGKDGYVYIYDKNGNVIQKMTMEAYKKFRGVK